MRALIALWALRLRRSAFPVKKCDALNTITAIAVRSAWLLMTTLFLTPFRAAALMTLGLDHAIASTGTTPTARTLRSGRCIVGPLRMAVTVAITIAVATAIFMPV